MANRCDEIVMGARCAGSPTAMLLARQGYKVLTGAPGPTWPLTCTKEAKGT